MRHQLFAALIVLLTPLALRADPITIVDTGPGPSTLPGFSLFRSQWLAVEFDVSNAATITGAEGWLLQGGRGSLGVALYQGGGDIPGPILFFATGFINSGTADWHGVSGLTWSVAPGTYWLAFEPRGPGSIGGAMPFPSERPLLNGAARTPEQGFRYFEADEVAQIGVRIFAEPEAAPIPEPASMLLVATGLAGVVARKRWRARLQA